MPTNPPPSFDTCAFSPKREKLADFLTDYLLEEKDGFVLNLNGSWGIGKTHFLKSWENKLSEQYPVVYIDAWKTDFADDPLLVVVNSIIEHLKIGSGGDTYEQEKRLMSSAYKLCKPLIKKGLAYSSSLVGIDGNVTNDVYEALEGIIKGSTNPTEHFQEYRNKLNAIEEFHEKISKWADCYKSQKHWPSDTPVFVLVDELDRCRPNYAIELLETVKHMFELPNFIFVIATDTEQLKHSIKAVYGEGFDSGQYLTRFFDRSFQLPKPDNRQYLEFTKSINDERIFKTCSIYPLEEQTLENLNQMLGIVTEAYGLELRDIDKLTAKLNACFRSIIKSKQKVGLNILCLIHGIITHQRNIEKYSRLPFIRKDPADKVDILPNNPNCDWLRNNSNNQPISLISVIDKSFDYLNQVRTKLPELNSRNSEIRHNAHRWFSDKENNNPRLRKWMEHCQHYPESFADWTRIKDLIEMSVSFDQDGDKGEQQG